MRRAPKGPLHPPSGVLGVGHENDPRVGERRDPPPHQEGPRARPQASRAGPRRPRKVGVRVGPTAPQGAPAGARRQLRVEVEQYAPGVGRPHEYPPVRDDQDVAAPRHCEQRPVVGAQHRVPPHDRRRRPAAPPAGHLDADAPGRLRGGPEGVQGGVVAGPGEHAQHGQRDALGAAAAHKVALDDADLHGESPPATAPPPCRMRPAARPGAIRGAAPAARGARRRPCSVP